MTRDSNSRTDGWEVSDPGRYAYLLGCYLGDGHVTHKPPGTWTLRLACDPKYPGIEEEISTAIASVFVGCTPRRTSPADHSVDVLSVTNAAVRDAFPQHGPGPKHQRPMILQEWQLEITRLHPDLLVRGLIHSDGCRTINRFRTLLPSGRVAEYSYVRYFFSNLSADIRNIFREHCGLLGIRVTQPNHRNRAIQHRDSVRIVERIVGAKC
ncbi:MAG TPA: hypothetical protein VG321_04140 [Solirubrobacteraceae bacterium]|nr:hypothetical protein [Solirubrobacteraceae bacterium]